MHFLDHDHGVGFTRVVDHADALGVRHDLLDQVHLLVQGQQIGHAGHVGLAGFPAADQLGGHGIGHGREHHGHGLGRGDQGLGRRRGDGDDGVGLVADELAGDLGSGAGIALGALVLPLEVLAGLVARVLERCLHAVAHGIERGVFHDGRHGHGFLLGIGRGHRCQGQGHCAQGRQRQVFH
ncbi:hypothetical protein D3C78_1204750 [compost metagenome]